HPLRCFRTFYSITGSPTNTALSFYELLYFLSLRHRLDRPFPRSDDGCRCIGECEHLAQLFFCEIMEIMLQEIVKRASPERIPGPCRLDRLYGKSRALYPHSFIVSPASIFPHSQEDQRDIIVLLKIRD